jgi:plastocyanin
VRTFDPTQLTAPADSPIVFQFHNADTTAPHDVSIRMPDGTQVWNGDPDAQPGQDATYIAPSLAAGEYEFFCSIHPATMFGPLSVGSP